MLPQPDAAVLETNPLFAGLWKEVSERKKLNGVYGGGSGSGFRGGIDGKKSELGFGIGEALRNKRVDFARREILGNAIRSVGFGDGSTMDAELQETVQIVSAQLDGKLKPEDKDIVEVEIEEFTRNIDTIAEAVEKHVARDMDLVCQVFDPTGNTATATLPRQLQDVKTSIGEAKYALGAKRVELANTLTSVLSTNAQLLQTAIRALEQVLHGSVGRYTRAQAEHLANVAKGIEMRVMVLRKQVLGQVYGDGRGVEEKLRGKREEEEARIVVFRRRLRDRNDWLEELDGVQGLSGAVEEVRRLRQETERVKEEVERLQQGR